MAASVTSSKVFSSKSPAGAKSDSNFCLFQERRRRTEPWTEREDNINVGGGVYLLNHDSSCQLSAKKVREKLGGKKETEKKERRRRKRTELLFRFEPLL